jgi:hypothetical protein
MQEQFTKGSLNDWNLELNVCSLNGTQYPARPVADPPSFSFPTMPSGKPGLKVHPGKYWMLENGPTSPAHNETNKYFLSAMINTKGGEVSLKTLCQKANNGYITIYLKTDKFNELGTGKGVATGYTTNWMPLKFNIPAGQCLITIFLSGDAMQTGADISIDSFVLPD